MTATRAHRYSLYRLYWYKSTNNDAAVRADVPNISIEAKPPAAVLCCLRQVLSLLAELNTHTHTHTHIHTHTHAHTHAHTRTHTKAKPLAVVVCCLRQVLVYFLYEYKSRITDRSKYSVYLLYYYQSANTDTSWRLWLT